MDSNWDAVVEDCLAGSMSLLGDKYHNASESVWEHVHVSQVLSNAMFTWYASS